MVVSATWWPAVSYTERQAAATFAHWIITTTTLSQYIRYICGSFLQFRKWPWTNLHRAIIKKERESWLLLIHESLSPTYQFSRSHFFPNNACLCILYRSPYITIQQGVLYCIGCLLVATICKLYELFTPISFFWKATYGSECPKMLRANCKIPTANTLLTTVNQFVLCPINETVTEMFMSLHMYTLVV